MGAAIEFFTTKPLQSSKRVAPSMKGHRCAAFDNRRTGHGPAWTDCASGREVRFDGPCYLKLLMPNHAAGVIIGKDGHVIGEIERSSKCHLQLSPSSVKFPGTVDRIMIMDGSMHAIEKGLSMLLRRFVKAETFPSNTVLLKMAVPSSAVSAIIGFEGSRLRNLVARTDCRINVTHRCPGLQERLLLIHGQIGPLLASAVDICETLQGDPHLLEHMHFMYEIDVPLGAFAGTDVADPAVPLLHPADTTAMTKREIVTYLRAAAPRDVLTRASLLGKLQNSVRSKSLCELNAVVEETWRSRGGHWPINTSPQFDQSSTKCVAYEFA